VGERRAKVKEQPPCFYRKKRQKKNLKQRRPDSWRKNKQLSRAENSFPKCKGKRRGGGNGVTTGPDKRQGPHDGFTSALENSRRGKQTCTGGDLLKGAAAITYEKICKYEKMAQTSGVLPDERGRKAWGTKGGVVANLGRFQRSKRD